MRFSFANVAGALLLSTAFVSFPANAQQRVDQLGAASAISGSDKVAVCQGCNSSTGLLGATYSQILTYIQANVVVPISTGVSGLATNVATFLTTPSSLNLRQALTDETGTGVAVFGTSPTISGLTLGDVNGLPQCLHADASGVVTGTGADCGAGGGGTPAGTTGAIQYNSGSAFAGAVVTGIVKGNGTSAPSAAVNGTDYTKITAITCSGTDKLSALSASGVGTCTADATGGGTITITDGTNSVSSTTSLTFDPASFVVSGSAGSATVKQTTGINAQSGSTYTLDATDAAKSVHMTNASATTITVLAAATAGAGYSTFVECDAGCTLNRSSSDTIDGATSVTLAAKQKIYLESNGSVWRAGILPAVDPSNATNLTSGTVAAARGGAGTSNGILKANGSGAVSAAVSDTDYAAVATAKKEFLQVAFSDEGTAITTGTAKVTFRMPYAMTVTEVRGSLGGACTTGTFTVDINEGGTTILSTKLTIDATEKTSTTAATPAVISDSALADDAEMTIDVDVTCSTGNATGGKVTLIGTRS